MHQKKGAEKRLKAEIIMIEPLSQTLIDNNFRYVPKVNPHVGFNNLSQSTP